MHWPAVREVLRDAGDLFDAAGVGRLRRGATYRYMWQSGVDARYYALTIDADAAVACIGITQGTLVLRRFCSLADYWTDVRPTLLAALPALGVPPPPTPPSTTRATSGEAPPRSFSSTTSDATVVE